MLKKYLGLSLLIHFIILINGEEDEPLSCNEHFLCTDDFCTSDCAPKDCDPPDNTECEGISLNLYDKSEDFCSCCRPKCVKFLKKGEQCSMDITSVPSEMCGPQLACSPSSNSAERTCQLLKTKCVNERQKENLGLFQQPPECDDEGNYKPMQCTPGGLCRCVDIYTGNPVALGFGITSGTTEAMDSEMNCQCALSYHNSLNQGCQMQIDAGHYHNLDEYSSDLTKCIQKAQKVSAFQPQFGNSMYFKHGHSRCLTNGNYDPIQCIPYPGIEGQCVCVVVHSDGNDNHLYPNGTTQFQSNIQNLKCFDENIHVPEYYRPCEKVIYEIEMGSKHFFNQLVIPSEPAPICTPDGYFAKLQHDHENDSKYCSDRDGKIIEDFQDVSSDSSSGLAMNCECAMARKYLSPLSTKPSCCKNGNFMGKQCKEGFCFCVNMYGQQIAEEFDQLDPDQPDCEDFCCDNNDDEPLSNWCQSHMPFKPVT